VSPLRRARNAVRNLFCRNTVERELDDELRAAFDLLVEEKRRAGLPPPDARRAAALELGPVESLKDQVRDVRAGALIDSILHDLRYATRMFHRRPGATLVAAAMLAIAIGVTSAMFTLVDALLLRPVPFRAPDELARVWMRDEHGGSITVTPAVLAAWRECGAFAAVESADAESVLIEFDAGVAIRESARVTPGIFDLLGGVRPIRGRLFVPSDAVAGNNDRVLLSDDVWRSLYHHDPGIIGRRITIGGESVTVIGILPAAFRFPEWNTAIWRPVAVSAPAGHGAPTRARAFVRFAKNMPRADAERLATAAGRAADPANAGKRVQIDPLAGLVLDPYYQRAVPVLAGAVALMFLVLCANVSSLLLARLTVRQREFGLRSALGASRQRLLRQGLAESLVLGVLAIAFGLGVGWLLVSLARTFLPEAFLIRTLNPLDLDLRATLFASASGLAATLAAGVLPAWLGSRMRASGSLQLTDRGATDTRGARTAMRALLTVEVALACVLLVGATLLVRSFMNLTHADRGLDSKGVMTATLSLPRPAFPDATSRTAAAQSIEQQVRALPGVRQASWSYGIPPDGGAISFGNWTSDAGRTVDMTVERYWVGSQLFSLYDIPLLRGRAFGTAEPQGTVIVGERLAEALWPGADPVGRTFSFLQQRFRVIGVAREIHHPSLDPRVDRPEFYEPFSGVSSYANLSLRCDAACPDPAVIRQRIALGHPAARIVAVRPLDDAYFEELARPRASAALAFVFAVIATMAAAGGLFSVLSYAVARRRREFGIRTALGASGAQIGALIVRDGMSVALTGLVIGALGAGGLARVLGSLQYGVTMRDPASWTIVVSVLTLTSVLASWRPARHATLVNPVLLLREE
jgi:predicted permease